VRKLLILVVAGAAAASMVPAHAKTIQKKTVTLSALPCLIVLCPNWLPHADHPTGPVPFTEADVQKNLSYACTSPIVSNVYADVVVTAPKGAKILVADYKPTIDWDVFICAKPKSGNNGAMLANENASSSDPTACPTSCKSFASTKVKPGTKYVIRAYNFSDYDSLKLTYTFSG
jgi:hypothetical protein